MRCLRAGQHGGPRQWPPTAQFGLTLRSAATHSLDVLPVSVRSPAAQARKALAEAKTIGEVKAVRDQEQAAIKWAKSRRDIGLEAQNDAAEIVLEAGRRLGKMLAVMDGKGSHGGDRKSSDIVSLEEMGIGRKQSSRWQAEARVPKRTYMKWIAQIREAGKQLTSGALVKLGRQRPVVEEQPKPIEGVFGSLAEIVAAGHKFGCIYADPPWKYGNQATRASTDNHYPTMTVEEICQEPVAEVAARPWPLKLSPLKRDINISRSK